MPKEKYDLETPDGRARFNADHLFEGMKAVYSARAEAPPFVLNVVAVALASTMEIQRSLRVELEQRIAALEAAPAADTAGLDVSESRFSAIEQRLAALETAGAKSLRDGGVFERGRSYTPGEVVVHRGQSWVCRAETDAQPGSDASWRLMTHRPKDKRR